MLERSGLTARLSAGDWAIAEYERAHASRRVEAIRSALALVGPACAALGLKPVLLKGTSYHGLLYDDPRDRPSGDIDVFLPCDDVLQLCEVMARLGFVPAAGTREALQAYPRRGTPSPWALELVFTSPAADALFEVKGDPITLGPSMRSLPRFGEAGPPSPAYPGFHLLSADAMVVYQALHLARRPQRDLLAHVELAGVLRVRRAEIDPHRALDLLNGEGLHGILRRVLEDTERLFPGSVPRGFFAREGRGAGLTSPLLRRGTLVARPERIVLRRVQTYLPHLVGGASPVETLRWGWGMLFPPEPLLSYLATPGVGKAHLRPARRVIAWTRRLRRA